MIQYSNVIGYDQRNGLELVEVVWIVDGGVIALDRELKEVFIPDNSFVWLKEAYEL